MIGFNYNLDNFGIDYQKIKSEDEIESTIISLEPKLLIHANKNDKKRRTQTDISYYN